MRVFKCPTEERKQKRERITEENNETNLKWWLEAEWNGGNKQIEQRMGLDEPKLNGEKRNRE